MKLLMVICYETDLPKVVAEIEAAGSTEYTFLTRLSGRGKGGRHLNTEAAPGFNAAMLIGCDELTAAQIQGRLRTLHADLTARRPRAGLHAFCWEAEQWL